MKSHDYDSEYSKIIDEMASRSEHGEAPHIYDPIFRYVAGVLLRKERASNSNHSQLNSFSCLILHSEDKDSGNLLELVAEYLAFDEEDDQPRKINLANNIANTLAKNALLYYKSDIEEAVKDQYKKYYEPDYLKAFGSFEEHLHAL